MVVNQMSNSLRLPPQVHRALEQGHKNIWNSPRVAGSLLRDPRRARPVMVEGQLSSSTDPAESPMKEASKATPECVQIGDDDRQFVATRHDSV